MKKIILINCSILIALLSYDTNTGLKKEYAYAQEKQTFNYEKAWEKVTAYSNKGLPKSALKEVTSIYEMARTEKNSAQLVRALIHKIIYLQEVEEETLIKVQQELQKEIATSSYPVSPLLHSMIAEQYWNYYQRNRYRFLNRTTTKEFKQDDMRTWDLKKIVEQVVYHYTQSLRDEKKSKKTPIAIYDDILYNNYRGRSYRPTLYDFLAHRALDFFMNSEAGLTRPAEHFTLNDKKYFSSQKQFTRQKITTQEALSFHYQALIIFQKLLQFHQNDKKPGALIDVDLKRLRFLYDKAQLPGKNKIYEQALQRMAQKYRVYPEAAEIYYEQALLYYNLGDTYAPGEKTTYKLHKKKAHALCSTTIKKYPESTGGNKCRQLRDQIESRQIQLTLEQAAIPARPFRTLVHYQNIPKLYLRIIATNRKELAKQKRFTHQKLVAYYCKKNPVASWQQVMPNENDYQTHRTEIKCAPLQAGKYIVLAANSKDFNQNTHAVAYATIDVTGIAYIQRNATKNGLEFYLLHRDTGKPLLDAQIQIWHRKWNNKQQQYNEYKGKKLRVNRQGYVHIKPGRTRGNYFYLEFQNGNDRYYPETGFSAYGANNPYQTSIRTYFFTDRSIYRPGQTVYFKGLKLHQDTGDGRKNKIITDSRMDVTLYDVNRQKVKELQLTTNEYGTCSGSFELPEGRLNGTFSISDGYGTVYFSVEEYKRPKFHATFQPITRSYRLHNMVTITGKAEAYAGYTIDQAQVRYRVVRQVFYPYHWYFWGQMPQAPSMQLKEGVTTTNAKGEFTITFKATPDETIDKNNQPAFNYMVYADITDINGETRSTQTSISIGYTALKLHIYTANTIDKEQKNYHFAIQSTNLSGTFIPAKGELRIYKLQEPGRIFRTRLWQKPDTSVMQQKEYYHDFPHDLYADEQNIHDWKKIKQVYTTPLDTKKTKEIVVTNIADWKSGAYLIESTAKDAFGNKVKEQQYITLYSAKEKKPPYPMLEWIHLPEKSYQPGDTAELLIGSSDKDVHVLYELEHHGTIIDKKTIRLNNEQKRIEVPIKEAYRGNVGVLLTFIKHNRVFRQNRTLHVPWSNKELPLSFATFRNKLQPGEDEEWRITVKGQKKDTIAAEMVATLYDASLDSIQGHNWNFSPFPYYYSQRSWYTNNSYATISSYLVGHIQESRSYAYPTYDKLNWFGFYWRNYYGYRTGLVYKSKSAERRKEGYAESEADDMKMEEMAAPAEKKMAAEQAPRDGAGAATTPEQSLSEVKARKNLQETAFFYPHLTTNKKGEIIISFKMPEALTSWRMMGFAHTRQLEYGFLFNELVTQKELMVVPNTPRFFRENDTIIFSAKITNQSDKELAGNAALMLFDAATMQPIDEKFNNTRATTPFHVKKGASTLAQWELRIPEEVSAVSCRVVARAGKFSDGEEQVLPVIKNKMLVTESIPLPVRSKETKKFTFQKLLDANKSSTLRHHKLTLEFTSNPAWYAVQALPYIMEYPYECLEQTFSRYYANSIAAYIVQKHPKIKKIFDSWKTAKNSNALLSNLEKNQELKSLLLEETPWVMQAQNETERKKRIALLFDMHRMSQELDRALRKMEDAQLASGAWPWFDGMREDRYITQHIVNGFAHLDALKVTNTEKTTRLKKIIRKALPYLDRKLREDYENLIRKKISLHKNNLNYIQIHYLYARSYFQAIPIDDRNKKAFAYYKKQAATYWLDYNRYLQGMIAISLHRYHDKKVPKEIIASIKEHALHSEEMGMYWKDSYGYYWYQAPIETQALMIELFTIVTKDKKSIDEMKTWLLKQKQTQNWHTTKATVEACYALLLQGGDWLAEEQLAEITLGSLKINPAEIKESAIEAGTGYFKTSWPADKIQPEMGNITVKNNNNTIAWGAVYWQYFENLDKITPHKTPLQLTKKLFLEEASKTGPVLVPISKRTLKTGDRIKVRIELRVDRTMEYVHMKDMRAAGFEPEHVISRYQWQDGLGYYESTKDASTNFFFSYLPKGTYVFEYPLRVTHRGDFSNGITTIQCMYAPEFSSHSEGTRVQIP